MTSDIDLFVMVTRAKRINSPSRVALGVEDVYQLLSPEKVLLASSRNKKIPEHLFTHGGSRLLAT